MDEGFALHRLSLREGEHPKVDPLPRRGCMRKAPSAALRSAPTEVLDGRGRRRLRHVGEGVFDRGESCPAGSRPRVGARSGSAAGSPTAAPITPFKSSGLGSTGSVGGIPSFLGCSLGVFAARVALFSFISGSPLGFPRHAGGLPRDILDFRLWLSRRLDFLNFVNHLHFLLLLEPHSAANLDLGRRRVRVEFLVSGRGSETAVAGADDSADPSTTAIEDEPVMVARSALMAAAPCCADRLRRCVRGARRRRRSSGRPLRSPFVARSGTARHCPREMRRLRIPGRTRIARMRR